MGGIHADVQTDFRQTILETCLSLKFSSMLDRLFYLEISSFWLKTFKFQMWNDQKWFRFLSLRSSITNCNCGIFSTCLGRWVRSFSFFWLSSFNIQYLVFKSDSCTQIVDEKLVYLYKLHTFSYFWTFLLQKIINWLT